MRANKTIVKVSIILACISFLVAFFCSFDIVIIARETNIVLTFISTIAISIFTGSLCGIITPITYYMVTKRQMQIEFINISGRRLHTLLDVVQWYTSNYKKLSSQIPNGAPRTENEMIARNDFDICVKQGVEFIAKYAEYDTERFYCIIDDYCGICKDADKIKQQMFSIRDAFNKYNYQYIGDLPFRHKIQNYNSKDFSGPIWFEYVIKEYLNKTNISDLSLQEVDSLLLALKKMSKITKYTQKVQGNKK